MTPELIDGLIAGLKQLGPVDTIDQRLKVAKAELNTINHEGCGVKLWPITKHKQLTDTNTRRQSKQRGIARKCWPSNWLPNRPAKEQRLSRSKIKWLLPVES
jgi:hypothetical protein